MRRSMLSLGLLATSRWTVWQTGLAGAVTVLVIVLLDRWLGESQRSLLARGLADETAHLLTAILLLAALPRRLPDRFYAAALLGAVAIDLDHLPLLLGSELLTATTNRPFTHGLLTAAVVLVATLLVWPRWRWRWIGPGLAFGLLAHFWRDLATSTAGVPLLWPLSTAGFRLPYALYLSSLLACVAIAVWRTAHARVSLG